MTASTDSLPAMPRAPRWLLPACLAGIVLLVFAVYWPGIHGGYVFDDFYNIVENPAFAKSFTHWRDWLAVALSSPSTELQRPLAMLSLAADVRLFGLDPVAMKITNIAIHALNVLLVFGLVRAIARSLPADGSGRPDTRADWLALFVAACWGLHPINLMAVLYVVQRMESLCHTFVFAGLWLYVLGRQRQLRGNGGWACVLGGLLGGTVIGTLSKESAVLLPLYALCIELFVFRFRAGTTGARRGLHAMYVAFLLLPALAALAWQLSLALRPEAYAMRDFSLGERLLTEPRVVLSYLQWTLLPSLRTLGLFHDDLVISRGLLDPPATLAAIVAIALLLWAAWHFRRRFPLAALGVAWFFAAQVLTATIIPLELVFEHRNYFASLGACMAVADLLLLSRALGRHRVGALLAGCFLLFCAGTTWLRANEWSNPVRFAASEASKHPLSARATYEYARAMIILSQYDPASPLNPEIRAALEKAQAVPGSGSLAVQATLIFDARTGAPTDERTWSRLQERIAQHPGAPQEQASLMAMTTCVVDKLCRFPPEQMLKTYYAALSHGPDAGVLSIYGRYALYVLGDRQLALRLWRDAARYDRTRNPQFQVNLAWLASGLGLFDEAQAHIAVLRGMGRMHQYDGDADRLQVQLDAARGAAAKDAAR